MTPKILYILECKHIMPGPIGATTLECLNCDLDGKITRQVRSVHTWEWRMLCSTCKRGRWCGLSKQLAGYFANDHARKRNEHKVNVLYQENPDAVKVQKRLLEGSGLGSLTE